MQIRFCEPADLEAVTAFAFERNADPTHRSSYCYTKYDSIHNEFKAQLASGEKTLAAAFDGERPVALLGVFIDEERRTADCAGPFVETGAAERGGYIALSRALLRLVAGHAPFPLDFQFFFDSRNTACLSLMRDLGASDRGNELLMEATRASFVFQSGPRALPLPPGLRQAFSDMHDRIHKGVYVSGKEILASDDRSVFIIPEGEGVAASGVLKRAGSGSLATLEIIATREDLRRRGYGRAIVNSLAERAFSDPAVERLNLIVDGDNEGAIALYRSCGFFVATENCAYSVSSDKV